jgi:outer membrane protein assembly factor BamE (lipoprotein component of BamABCDE complex)
MFESCRNASVFLRQPRSLFTLACMVAALGLTACSSSLIYKPEVVQGNFVSREQVQALRAGMPRQAVRDVLGTPLVTSLFHAERWQFSKCQEIGPWCRGSFNNQRTASSGG